MTTTIQGIGFVTPLGRDSAELLRALREGRRPPGQELSNPFLARSHRALPVDPAFVAGEARLPRLRRSSAISHFAVAAARDALRDGACDPAREKLGLVFASTNGGVNYTRRFFADVSRSGAQAGSPLLFPETVYNAPASHIAATLGIDGVATTLVNDATVVLEAIDAAQELLAEGECERCLVVAAEELDWSICEAYAQWKFGKSLVFSEGAVALLLGSGSNGVSIERVSRARRFRTLDEAAETFADPGAWPLVVSSATGTRFDKAERNLAATERLAPRLSLGEAFSASALLQVAVGTLALREGLTRALVPVIGYHGNVGAIALRG